MVNSLIDEQSHLENRQRMHVPMMQHQLADLRKPTDRLERHWIIIECITRI